MNKPIRKCCIENCASNTETQEKKVTMYKFPEADSADFLAWLKFAGPSISAEHFNRKRLIICALHFAEECFEQNKITILRDGEEVHIPRTVQRLKKAAVPTIFPIVSKSTEEEKQQRPNKPFCVVKECPGKDNAKIRLFSIPRSDTVAWCQNLRLKRTDLNICSRVCSRHFEESSMGWQKLKKGARPTLDLGHKPMALSQVSDRKGNTQYRVCCILNCTKKSPPNTLFGFPSDNLRLKRWISICQFKAGMKFIKQKYICENHFDPSMINRKDDKMRLSKNAIPVMNANTNLPKTYASDFKIVSVNSLQNIEDVQPQIDNAAVFYEIQEFMDSSETELKTEPIDAEIEPFENVVCHEIEIQTTASEMLDMHDTKSSIKAEAIDTENVCINSFDVIVDNVEPTSSNSKNAKIENPAMYDVSTISKLDTCATTSLLDKCKTCEKLREDCKTYRERCLLLEKELQEERSKFVTFKTENKGYLTNEWAKNQALRKQNELILAELKALKRKVKLLREREEERKN